MPVTWPRQRHKTDGVHQAREQRRENGEERWLDNKCHDEDEGTLRFGLGKERRGLWSVFRLGTDKLGCDTARRNAPEVHGGESKGNDSTVVTRVTGLRPMWLG
jgi:hypothetical protein